MKLFGIAAVPQKLTAKTLFTVSLIALVGSTMVGCGTLPLPNERSQKADGAGKRVDTRTIPDAVPKVEPITRAGNKSPYTVFGKTYFVMANSDNFSQTGTASWYGSKFHGRKTSNGEIYNMYAMTAAHKSLPIPSYVRVTNLENKRSIIVRVNDRGPFHGPRIIDLSYVAALKLGYADKGTAKVLVEVIDPSGNKDKPPLPVQPPTTVAQIDPAAPTDPVAEPKTPLAISGSYLQVGAFDNPDSAQQLQKQVRGYTALPILVQQRNNMYKVWVGPIADKMELSLIRRILKQSANISSFLVKP